MRWVNQRCFATAAPRAVSVANPQLFFSVAFWYQKLYLYYVNGNDCRHVLNFGKWRLFRNLFCVLKLYSIECHWWFQATQSNYFFIITLCIETYRKGAATILQSYDSAKKKKKSSLFSCWCLSRWTVTSKVRKNLLYDAAKFLC